MRCNKYRCCQENWGKYVIPVVRGKKGGKVASIGTG